VSRVGRDWMQIEIWSPRTTKILIRIVLAGCFVVFASCFLLKYWLNPWEQQALREVMQRAVVVRHASNDDLEREFAHSKAAQELAERRAWSLRDHAVASLTNGAVGMAYLCRRNEVRRSVKHENQAFDDQMGKFGCNEYELQMQYSREALQTRLGF
jgi:hypothetical protein